MHIKGHKIKKVLPGGIAEEMGVEAGMSILKVNDVVPEDVFDYQYLMEDEYVTVLIREADGTETLLEIEKDPDEDFGVEFESSLMDDYRHCSNRCIFCFIDQMPAATDAFSVSSIRCRRGCGIRSILKMTTLVSAFFRVIMSRLPT